MKLRAIHWLAIAGVVAIVLWWMSRPEEGGELEAGDPDGSPTSRGRGFGVIPGLLGELPNAIEAALAGEEIEAGVGVHERPPMLLQPEGSTMPYDEPEPSYTPPPAVQTSPTGIIGLYGPGGLYTFSGDSRLGR